MSDRNELASPCSNCPNKTNREIFWSVDIDQPPSPGKAEVLLTENGDVYWAYSSADFGEAGSKSMSGTLRAGIAAKEYHGLRDALVNCEGPENIQIPRSGMLGKLGLKKITDICPAIWSQLDPSLAESVKQYFITEESEQWQ